MTTLSSATVLLAQASPTSSPSFLIFLVLMFALMYFGLIRPQLRDQKAQKAMLSTLKRGDEMVTSGGIFGRILLIEEKIVTLDIGGGVKMRVLKQSLQARITPEAAKAEGDAAKDEKKDDKPK